MESASFIGMSKAMTLRRQMDTISHNVANMNTTGFKQQQMLVTQHQVQPAEDGKAYRYVTDLASRPNMEQGPLQKTGSDLDFALQGDGYFVLDSPTGERYTRAGNFRLNNQRELVNAQGQRVLDENDNPIEIPQGVSSFSTTDNGTLTANGEEIAQLKTVRFADDRVLEHVGHGQYATQDPALPADDVQVKQGFLEGSNVDGVTEMARMIEVQRSYSSTQNIMKQEHQRMQQAIRQLARVSS